LPQPIGTERGDGTYPGSQPPAIFDYTISPLRAQATVRTISGMARPSIYEYAGARPRSSPSRRISTRGEGVVLVGCLAFATAAVAWRFAHPGSHPVAAYAAALAGLLAVALIHTRTWRGPNPWRKRNGPVR
jgi:hypothetical protein